MCVLYVWIYKWGKQIIIQSFSIKKNVSTHKTEHVYGQFEVYDKIFKEVDLEAI